MAIPFFEEDMDILGSLGDDPKSEDGLTTEEFKTRFDEAGKKIKEFLNKTLIPAINVTFDADELAAYIFSKVVSINGDTMKGNLDMNRNRIMYLADPVDATDSANKGYVDNKAQEVEKYVDEKVKRFKLTLLSTNWLGSSAPYTQTISVNGISDDDEPHYGPVYTGGNDTKVAEKEAWALIDDLDTADGSVTFTCFEEKPEIDLTVQMEVHR